MTFSTGSRFFSQPGSATPHWQSVWHTATHLATEALCFVLFGLHGWTYTSITRAVPIVVTVPVPQRHRESAATPAATSKGKIMMEDEFRTVSKTQSAADQR